MLSPKITAGSVTTCFWKRAGRMRFRSAELGSDGSKSTSIGWGPVATPIGRVGFWTTPFFLCFSLQKMARDMLRWTKNWFGILPINDFLLDYLDFWQSFSSTWGQRDNPSLDLQKPPDWKLAFCPWHLKFFAMPKIPRRIYDSIHHCSQEMMVLTSSLLTSSYIYICVLKQRFSSMVDMFQVYSECDERVLSVPCRRWVLPLSWRELSRRMLRVKRWRVHRWRLEKFPSHSTFHRGFLR